MAINKAIYPNENPLEEADLLLEVDMESPLTEQSDEPVSAEGIVLMLEDGGAEIDYGPEKPDLSMLPFDTNLAEHLDEGTLTALANDLMEDVDRDIADRREWVEQYVEGLKVLGLQYEKVTQPWEDACGAYSSLLLEAVSRFQAETMGETFPASGPVKTKILGKETREKREAAARVSIDMNYLLTEKIDEYRTEHERMLFGVGLAGSAFKKVYRDEKLGRPAAPYLPSEDVIVPYGCSTIEHAHRVCHIMRKTKSEMEFLQASGFYTDEDLGDPVTWHSDIAEAKAELDGYDLDDDDRHTLYEISADMIIPGIDEEGELSKPYVITIEKSSGKVIGLRRNWKEGDPKALRVQHFVHYYYMPGFGFYGLGLIHLVGGYSLAGTSLLRQLVDAGTLSNLPGGFKARGARIKGDDEPIEPGEWRDMEVPNGGALKDNLMALPYGEPSATLYNLMEKITEEGRRLGAIGDMNISDMSANAPVGTTLALLERTLKPMTAVQARIHFAMKAEFKILKRLVSEDLPDSYDYEPGTGDVTARRSDYEMVDIIPVSDPNSATMAQRVIQYQAAFQMSQSAPHIYDLPYLHRQMLEVIGIANAEKIVPTEEDMVPTDPISENMAALTGKPVKAFIYQDHQAHIAAHMAFMQDPAIAQVIGQNPQAQQIMAALHAHIAEHLGFAYRKQIEDKLGAPLPPPGQELPEEIEVHLSRLVADGAQQLTQQNQKTAAQQQAEEQAQDPVFQQKEKELGIKEAEVKRKGMKDQMDAKFRQLELLRKEKELTHDQQMDKQKLELEVAELILEYNKANEPAPRLGG